MSFHGKPPASPAGPPRLRKYEYYTQAPGKRVEYYGSVYPWTASPKTVEATYLSSSQTHIIFWRTEADGTDTVVLAEHADFVYSLREVTE